jgi:hypothetical protein
MFYIIIIVFVDEAKSLWPIGFLRPASLKPCHQLTISYNLRVGSKRSTISESSRPSEYCFLMHLDCATLTSNDDKTVRDFGHCFQFWHCMPYAIDF